MTSLVIPTANLDLVLQSPDELLARIEAMPPADRAEVSPAWLERVRKTSAGDPWALGFNVVERSSGVAIGGCGFKGPPDQGLVELAYGTDPDYRGRGYATEAASGLARFAFASGLVDIVCAHTKPHNEASARVLAKSGFVCVGEIADPEDGLVQRWELRKVEPPSTPHGE